MEGKVSRTLCPRWERRYISKNGGPIFVKSTCFSVTAKDTWVLIDFHENSRVFGVNEKTWIFDHFPKGYISKNGGRPPSPLTIARRPKGAPTRSTSAAEPTKTSMCYPTGGLGLGLGLGRDALHYYYNFPPEYPKPNAVIFYSTRARRGSCARGGVSGCCVSGAETERAGSAGVREPRWASPFFARRVPWAARVHRGFRGLGLAAEVDRVGVGWGVVSRRRQGDFDQYSEEQCAYTYFSFFQDSGRVSIWDAPYDTGYGLHLAK